MASTTPCAARMRFAAIRSSISAGSTGPAEAGRCCASAGADTTAARAKQMLTNPDANLLIDAAPFNSLSAEVRLAFLTEGQRSLLGVLAQPHAFDGALGEI